MYQIDKIQTLRIGVQGENNATNIEIDMSSWANAFPDAQFYVLFKPYNSAYVYPMTSLYDSENQVLTWKIGAVATAVVGVGYTEIRAQDSNGLIKKTRIIPTVVEDSVSGIETDPPEAQEEWVTAVLNAGTDAKNSAAAAMAYSQGKQIKFEIGDDDDPDGMAGHLLFYFKDEEDEEWEDYLDLGPVDVYAMAVATGYTGTKAQWVQSMNDAESNAQKAEKYAVGKVNGTDVGSTDPAYHNNSKYYSEQAAGSATDAIAAKVAAQAAQEAAESAAQTDLVEWLEENITNPSSPPLDRTLSSSSSATPADITGDLKSALDIITGNELIINFTHGYYIKDNEDIGDVIDLTPIEGTNRNYYTVVNVSGGDVITINGTGGNAGRLWAFIDGDNKLLKVSGNAATANNLVLIAPQNASKLILHQLDTVLPCFHERALRKTVGFIQNTEKKVGYIEGSFNITAGSAHSSDNDLIVVDIPNVKKLRVKMLTSVANGVNAYQVYAWNKYGSSTRIYSDSGKDIIVESESDIYAVSFYISGSNTLQTCIVTIQMSVFDGDNILTDLDNKNTIINAGKINSTAMDTLIEILGKAVFTENVTHQISKLISFLVWPGKLSILKHNAYYYSTDGEVTTHTEDCVTIRYALPNGVRKYTEYLKTDGSPDGLYNVYFDTNGDYIDYHNMNTNGRHDTEVTLTANSGTVYIGFTLNDTYAEESYCYLPSDGTIIFAGSSSKYAGMTNISQYKGE